MIDHTLTIRQIVYGDGYWEPLANYAENCSWGAGKLLAKRMRANGFNDWERVFAAFAGFDIAAYCTLTKMDCVPDVPYTPYIGFMFVREPYRGNRISEKLIGSALRYAGGLGFDRVYLVSDHKNLYEKYGFVKVDEKPAPWNPEIMETIFSHLT